MPGTTTSKTSPEEVILAIDLGGTKLETALVERSGRVHRGSVYREATGPDVSPRLLADALHRAVALTVAQLPPGVELTGVGVASAGPIDHEAGTISPVNMTGLGRDYPLVDAVRETLADRSLPIRLGHDGGSHALAEAWFGAARQAETSMTFVVSTGIGGGIVHRGELFGGATGNAGHLGQIAVGDRTLEELAAGPASIRWAVEQGWVGATGEQLAAAAAAGDEIARAAVVRSATYVGAALASVAAIVDVDTFVIGGGFAKVSGDYVPLVERELHRTAPLAHLTRIRVLPSELGADGPLLGAASLMLRPTPHAHSTEPDCARA